MINLDKHKIYLGDFHTHWYWDKENSTVFLAGMNYLGLDFVLLQDGIKRAEECDSLAANYHTNFRFFPGKEIGYSFAHIVTWLDRNCDESELSSIKSNIPPKEVFRRIKEKTRLTIFAHPGLLSGSAAYDGSFNPLIELYKEGLIDGIQIQDAAPYLAFLEKGIEVPVVAGFDVHLCKRLPAKSPDYLFSKDIHPFDIIAPCSKLITIVFAEELGDEAIIEAVKSSKTVVYNLENDSFIGPSSLVKILKEENYIQKRMSRINKRNKIQIKAKDIIVGEKASIKIESVQWNSSKDRIYYPANSLYHSQESKNREVTVDKFPSLLKRSQFYFPLNVKVKDENFIFAVLAKEPIVMNLNSRVERVERTLHYYIDCLLENRSCFPKEVQIELESELSIDNPKVTISLNKNEKKCHLFEVTGLNPPGFEYQLKSQWICGDLSLSSLGLISFPICSYLEEGGSPWHISEEDAMIVKEPFQVREYSKGRWKGSEDCSGKINLYWDERNFYLYAEVEDDVFYQNWIDWETFWGDSIQFAFEPSIYRETRGYGTNYEFTLAKTKRGNEVMTWYTPQTGDNQVRKLSKTAFLDVIRDEPKKSTKYRFSIPWTSLKPFVPREGAQFKFAFVINDSDGPVIPQRCVLFYGGNIGECKDTSLAHSVTLVKLC